MYNGVGVRQINAQPCRQWALIAYGDGLQVLAPARWGSLRHGQPAPQLRQLRQLRQQPDVRVDDVDEGKHA